PPRRSAVLLVHAGAAIPVGERPRQGRRRFRVHVRCPGGGRGSWDGGGASRWWRELGGLSVVEDDSNPPAATCAPGRRDEHHSVGIVCGGPHRRPLRGAGAASGGAAGRLAGGAHRSAKPALSAANGVGKGGFSRSSESPSKAA